MLNRGRIILNLSFIILFALSCTTKSEVELIESQLEILSSDEFQGRETGTKGLNKAADFISGYFESLELKPYYSTYKDIFYIKDSISAYNVSAYIEGSEAYLKRRPVIISAHYDHIGTSKSIDGDTIANGANDNASGAVGVMQLAKRLKDTKPKRPILFVLFDAEEQGLIGSKYLALKFKSQDIKPYLIFNIEMIGVPMKDKKKQAYLTGYHKSNLPEYFNTYANKDALVYISELEKYNLFTKSDNYPFYQNLNIPAHTASSFDFTNYEYYHHVDDEYNLLDARHINSLVNLWKTPLLKIANHKNNLIKINN